MRASLQSALAAMNDEAFAALLAVMASFYAVFHGPKGLRAIAERDPQSLHDLEGISGMGTKKLQAYGADLLRVLGS